MIAEHAVQPELSVASVEQAVRERTRQKDRDHALAAWRIVHNFRLVDPIANPIPARLPASPIGSRG